MATAATPFERAIERFALCPLLFGDGNAASFKNGQDRFSLAFGLSLSGALGTTPQMALAKSEAAAAATLAILTAVCTSP